MIVATFFVHMNDGIDMGTQRICCRKTKENLCNEICELVSRGQYDVARQTLRSRTDISIEYFIGYAKMFSRLDSVEIRNLFLG